jgi:hypothetical protein
MVLITILTLVVLAFVGKLIYDVQQKKNKPTKSEPDFEYKDDFQKLAGIKPIYGNDELREIIVKNNLDAKEQIVEALLKAAKNGEFPKQDESINMGTTKIGTIHTNFGSDNDPLASVPMSRVSKAAKQKMAEIAKQDITARLEETAEKYATLIPEQKKCGCGRSETGYCTGLHTIPKKQWETGMTDLEAYAKAANPATKPKRKYKKKPKA